MVNWKSPMPWILIFVLFCILVFVATLKFYPSTFNKVEKEGFCNLKFGESSSYSETLDSCIFNGTQKIPVIRKDFDEFCPKMKWYEIDSLCFKAR